MKIPCNLIVTGWNLSEHGFILDFVLAPVVLAMTFINEKEAHIKLLPICTKVLYPFLQSCSW